MIRRYVASSEIFEQQNVKPAEVKEKPAEVEVEEKPAEVKDKAPAKKKRKKN